MNGEPNPFDKADPAKRPVSPGDARGHGLLLVVAAWAGVVVAQLAPRFPLAAPAMWLGLLAVLLLLSNLARRL